MPPRFVIATLSLALLPGVAWAQAWPACSGDPIDPHPSFSGHVYNQNISTPIVGATVRVWKDVGGKGWAIDCVATTGAGGAWSAVRPPGRYKIEAGGSTSTNQNLGGRWYDVVAPTSEGWAGEDADVFEANVAVAGIDVVLPLNGGLDMEVRIGGARTGGIQARLMRLSDPRVHHNDQSQGGPHLGRFYMRGLVPSAVGTASDYVLVLYDPSGARGLTVGGPYTITSGADLAGGFLTLAAAPVDGHEPNDTPDESGASSVDGDGLHAPTPAPWTSTSARIDAPGEEDWFCWEALAGDRYRVSTTSMITALSVQMRNPWLDPVAAVWDRSGPSPVLLVEDDDSGPDRDVFLDTFDIANDGELCVEVGTFGSASVGPYELRVEMGNRRPRISVLEDGAEVPLPPDSVTAFEDAEIVLDVEFDDPEGDPVTADLTFVDAFGLEVSGWTFQVAGTEGEFRWTPGPQAAADGPYALQVTGADDEFTTVADVIVAVATVNVPPEMPVAVAPLDGETVATGFPELSVTNGTDIDGDALWVEFEAYLDPLDPPWASDLVAQDASGVTSWETPFVPDATDVSWRARTYDGDLYSGWTELETFLVATFNDPPSVPVLEKPALGEVVLVRRPAVGVLDSTDPENDPISLFVEVAYDTSFTTLVASGGPILEDAVGPTTTMDVDADLAWGADVYWRARAEDALGARSAWSDTFWFEVKANVQPTAPSLVAPWGPTCDDLVAHAVPTSFPVNNATDPEGEPLTLEVWLFDAGAPAGATPLATGAAPQAAGAVTDVPLTYAFGEDGHYRVQVRADDGTDVSEWATCTFWLNAAEAPTTGFEIIDPPEGDLLTSDTVVVDAGVTNPLDQDSHLPGGALSLAWCLDGTGDGCTDVSAWNRLAFQGGSSTTFQVSGLVPDTDWVLHACAIDESGTCTATDEVAFRTGAPIEPDTGGVDISGDSGDDEGGCGCGGSTPATWTWVVALAVLARRRRL